MVGFEQKGSKMVAKESSDEDSLNSWLLEEEANWKSPVLVSERRFSKNGEARASRVLLVNT